MEAADKRTVTNVVFDMGGVLLDWDPLSYARAYTDTDEEAKTVLHGLFETSVWSLLDAGAVDGDTVLMAAHAALPERLHRAADLAFETFPALQDVIVGTNDLGFRLKDAGFGVYILSNVSTRFRTEFAPRIPLFERVDGAIVSAEEHLMKPDPAIFGLFCRRYLKAPETCLFVDDSAINCEGARRAGMHAHHFDGDVAALEARIAELSPIGF